MRILNRTSCTGATAGSNGRTRIRIINYAIYGDRGTWIAKKLRSLWSRGCDIKVIYAVSSRPVVGDPAEPLGSRQDPDATVGDHQQQARDREVQPQQVDDDRRQLGWLDAAPT